MVSSPPLYVPNRQRSVELIEAQLRRAGVEVRVTFAPRAVFLGQILPNGEYDLAEFGFGSTPDPGSRADIWRCSGESSYTGYCSRLVTQELAQSQLIVDAEQRARALNRADRQMAKAVPALPLGQDPQIAAFKGIRLRGLVYNGTEERILWNSEDWWLER